MTKKALVPAILILVAALAAACTTAQSSNTTLPAAGPGAAGVDAAKGGPAPVTSGTTPEQGIPSLVGVGRDLIVTANVAMRSDDPWATADRARGIARDLGGDILSLSQSGSGDQRSASLTMRVPSSRFDEAIAQLKRLDGEVVASSVGAKDVTDQLVDLRARLSAKQAEESRYLQLFASAKTVDEMLRVDAALANVRTQIEQLQAQLKSMTDQVSYSAITMSITPLAPSAEAARSWDPSHTFARALAALGSLFRGIADAAIWLLVFGWIPLVALAFALIATRARRGGAAAA